MYEIFIVKGGYGETIAINDIEVTLERPYSFLDIIGEFGKEIDYKDLGKCSTCGDWGYTRTYHLSDEYAELIFKLYNINLDEK